MRALVVDTVELHLAADTAGLLREMNCDVTMVAGYQSALDATRCNAFDSIILAPPALPFPKLNSLSMRGSLSTCDPLSTLDSLSTRDSLAKLNPPAKQNRQAGDRFNDLMQVIHSQHIAAIVVSDQPVQQAIDADALVDVVHTSVSMSELRGRFAMIDRYHTRLRRVEGELLNVEKLGRKLHDHFRELDQEMRLAARLQQDFLPQTSEPINGVQFAAIYRPASWVSGDIYDVFRVDEHRTAFYMADAVGHGVAASLLTMFIKRTMIGKRVTNDGYVILDPSESLSILNNALVEQALPNSQFVTACYGLLDHRTGELQFARGGHPYPILYAASGETTELKSDGGLLGLFEDEQYLTEQVTLSCGDKFMLFSDGVELAFGDNDNGVNDPHAYHEVFKQYAHLPVLDMTEALNQRLDAEKGSLNPLDDVTIVSLEILDRN